MFKNSAYKEGFAVLVVLAVVGILIVVGATIFYSLNKGKSSEDDERKLNYTTPTQAPVSDSDELQDLQMEIEQTNFDDTDLDAELNSLDQEIENF